jgi:ribosomal protein L14E/L6E/L27E
MKLHKGNKLGDVYAVHTGTYAGEMLIYIKQSDTHVSFLSIPNMVNRDIPIYSFDLGRNSDIIKYVERVPDYIRKIVKVQYEQNENSNHRYEQSSS